MIKWLTGMTTFTRIDGYGVHSPLTDYYVVRLVKLSNELKWDISSRK